jgi:hypothetical protein
MTDSPTAVGTVTVRISRPMNNCSVCPAYQSFASADGFGIFYFRLRHYAKLSAARVRLGSTRCSMTQSSVSRYYVLTDTFDVGEPLIGHSVSDVTG